MGGIWATTHVDVRAVGELRDGGHARPIRVSRVRHVVNHIGPVVQVCCLLVYELLPVVCVPLVRVVGNQGVFVDPMVCFASLGAALSALLYGYLEDFEIGGHLHEEWLPDRGLACCNASQYNPLRSTTWYTAYNRSHPLFPLYHVGKRGLDKSHSPLLGIATPPCAICDTNSQV
jgi:hypothetical protein